MSNQGWIILDRRIMDNWIWGDKPFSYGQAWVDMLLTANHKDNDILFEGKIISIPRGAFHTSILKLSCRFGWNRKKTTKFLDLLEIQKMVTTERTTHGTTITIVNYDKIQSLGATIDTTQGKNKVQPRNNHGTQTMNDNNDNNDNNKRERNKKFTPPTIEEVENYCNEKGYNVNPERFIDFYESKGWMIGKNKMKDWKAAIRTWVQRDNNSTRQQSSPSTSNDNYAVYQEMYRNLPSSPDDPFQ